MFLILLQFEITIKVLSDAETHYGDGDDMFISLGMKHADDYYWVGRTSVKYSSTPVAYNGEQVQNFYTNVPSGFPLPTFNNDQPINMCKCDILYIIVILYILINTFLSTFF